MNYELLYWQWEAICGTISPVALHYCRAVNGCSKNEKPLGLPIPSIINLINLFGTGGCWWCRTVFETAKGDYPLWCFGMKAVSVTDVLFFFWRMKKTQKIKRKKAKDTWQNEQFFDIFFFACCDAKAKRSWANRSLKLKGRERRISQRAKNLW